MTFHTLPLNTPALIVEPDAPAASEFYIALRCAGYCPYTVATGTEALKALVTFQPALVILDLQLQDLSGTEILEFIRTEHILVKTWVIAITSKPIAADAIEQNADMVLMQPVSFGQMRELALRMRRATL